ncbi:polymorphic toxin type 15 domain-containing protein [Rhodanobacter sp. AS-Z3]|nr:polymorphic toxin type 15 domain-containing protein [Rhodanobacter sp. AS-Z3]WEN16850.1 polymorphic toxin type 15 domain-containing protein [Rhodanobacter sp. AS-Z3]
MDRQLLAQQGGLNKMTVQDYLDGRARYAVDKRKGAGAAALKARKKYQARMERLLTAAHVQAGTNPRTAKILAQEAAADHFKTQDALHNPDMVAGGRSTAIDGMGDSPANRTIGRQWNKGAFEGMTRVKHMDDAALKVPVAERSSTLMNVDLHRCK